MAWGLIGHPIKDDFWGLGAPLPYVTGCYWDSALPLSNTISPWNVIVQKNVRI